MDRVLLDSDGENRAVRSFLMVYSCNEPVTVRGMREHMARSGWADMWPAWVNDANVDRLLHEQHLTKGGAQDWLRHLFALETAAAPAQAEPDAIRNTALEEAAQECWKLQARPEFEPEIQDKWLKIAENKIRALKS
jgi:hypothetical protein